MRFRDTLTQSSLCPLVSLLLHELRALDSFRQTLKNDSFQNLEQVMTSGTDETSFWTPLEFLRLLNVVVVRYYYSKLLLIYVRTSDEYI